MDEDQLNMGLRKFLKQVGVTSQREIERELRELRERKRGHQRGQAPTPMLAPTPPVAPAPPAVAPVAPAASSSIGMWST